MLRPGLNWVTLQKVSAAELTDIAARLQCGSVALLGCAPAPGIGRPVAGGEAAAIRSTLASAGMVLSSLDILRVAPDFDPDAHDALLDLGGALGAQRIGAVVVDPDSHRAADNLRAFAVRASAHGLKVGVEFVSFCPVRTLADATGLIDRIADPNVLVTFDILHFTRTGGKSSDLEEAAIQKIGNLQICDGPATMETGRLMWEATTQRLIPGEGCFDLNGVFAKFPAHLPIDIEAPMRDLDEQGVAPLEQARRLVAATSNVLNRSA